MERESLIEIAILDVVFGMNGDQNSTETSVFRRF